MFHVEFRRRWLGVFAVMFGMQCTLAAQPSGGDELGTEAARIRHVFIIVLENKDFGDTFGGSTQDPYLQKSLVPMGTLLTQYYGTGHVSLGNYIAMISGQAPTPDTEDDCFPGMIGPIGNYNDVASTGITPDGQVIADAGCIYPVRVKTLVDQLESAGFTWKGYMEDMGNDRARESTTCGHPPIGVKTDQTNTAEAPNAAVPEGDAYTTRHDPFAYFHSIIDSPSCQKNVVNLQNLTTDIAQKSTTPNFSFITPNLCHDGHDGSGTGAKGTTCANGEPGGLTSADAFLKLWVPRIMDSPAFRQDGLLIITFDESNYTLTQRTDTASGQKTVEVEFPGAACCNQPRGPNLGNTRPITTTLVNTPSLVQKVSIKGYGGDRIGALLVSPFVKRGGTSNTAYNHYSLLRSIEDLFGLHEHLGYAADNPQTGYHVDSICNDPNVFERRSLKSSRRGTPES